MKENDRHRVGMATLGRRLGGDTEPEWKVGHGVDNCAGIFFSVFGDSTETGLGHVVAVEELLLGGSLQPLQKTITYKIVFQ